jgi:hypothetical protein
MIVKRGLYHKENVTAELMDYFWKPMKSTEGRKSFVHFANCLNHKHLLEIEHDLPGSICRFSSSGAMPIPT